MPPDTENRSSAPAAGTAPATDASGRLVEGSERRNFVVLALYQIILRIGWIFKTESIVMPAVLDAIGGTPWLRGVLPVLNRFGQSVPPVLFSRRLKVARYKKRVLMALSAGMALPFLSLSAVWLLEGGADLPGLPWIFLGLYGAFFIVFGVNQVVLHTITGKLIRATRRGRLLTVSTCVSSPAAIIAALLFLGGWLRDTEHGFCYIFGFTGLMFFGTVFCGAALVEPPDEYEEDVVPPLRYLVGAYQVLRDDPDFRRLAIVAALFSTVLMLFPHYQALGRERLGTTLDDLLVWVVVQNAGTGLFSLLAGPVADRSGNRRVLRVLISCSTIPPLLAIALGQAAPELGRQLFWLVFVPIGLTPVTLRVLANYTLELAPPADHPRYISTLSLCVAGPILVLSPLVGLTVGLTSFEFVYTIGALIVLGAALLTWRLREPRHRVAEEAWKKGSGPFSEEDP